MKKFEVCIKNYIHTTHSETIGGTMSILLKPRLHPLFERAKQAFPNRKVSYHRSDCYENVKVVIDENAYILTGYQIMCENMVVTIKTTTYINTFDKYNPPPPPPEILFTVDFPSVHNDSRMYVYSDFLADVDWIKSAINQR